MAVAPPDSVELYPTNGDDPRVIAAFDTDMTVDYARGPVPLSHVVDLREAGHVSVWATGSNQTLRDNAEIPGLTELAARRDIPSGTFIERANRLRLLKREYPDADEYIVVDDVDLTELESDGWDYYHPYEYVTERLGFGADEWPDRVDMSLETYLGELGRFSGQLHPDTLATESTTPRDDRLGETGGIK